MAGGSSARLATTTANRIWAGTEVENIAEQRALERSGFQQEGLSRGTHFRDGQWRDGYVYAIVRGDLDLHAATGAG